MTDFKFTQDDAEFFYNSLYKGLYKNEGYQENNSSLKSQINEISSNNNPLGIKQLNYYPLAVDFFQIGIEKKISGEILLKYLGITAETWSAWVSSYNKGNIQTPVTLNNETINKMSVFCLKEAFNNYISNNDINIVNTTKEEIIKSVIEEEKKYKTLTNEQNKPRIKKIKP